MEDKGKIILNIEVSELEEVTDKVKELVILLEKANALLDTLAKTRLEINP